MVSAVLVGWIGEMLATSLQPTARAFGLSDLFVGIVGVPVAGNAAESTSAVPAARRNRRDLAVGIAIGSSIQIALFVAPALAHSSRQCATALSAMNHSSLPSIPRLQK
jgi:Ca2+:H+ antiporter